MHAGMPELSSDNSVTQGPATDLESNVKPLPHLPNLWDRFWDQIALFLRTVGLGILVTSFHGVFKKNFKEPQKIAIVKNRLTASLRATIHAIPLTIAIVELVLNLHGKYIGALFDDQTNLQFAAKAHEITIQASLALIFLSYVRHRIVQGKSIPFGALLGSVQFIQVSYLWSTEFWSALVANHFGKREKGVFTVLTLGCTLLAATAGPSSATLLIPRQNQWSLQSFYLFLNGTADTFWPSSMNGEAIPASCAVESSNSTVHDPLCLTYDFKPFIQSDMLIAAATPKNQQLVTLSFPLDEGFVDYVKTVSFGLCTSSTSDQYCTTAPQQIFYPSMTQNPPIGAAGVFDYEPQSYTDQYVTIQDGYYQPYTIASCVDDTLNRTMNQESLKFARISETQSELENDREILQIHNITLPPELFTPDNSSQFHVGWIDLPLTDFHTQVPGVIVLHPQETSNGVLNITTCTLNAGWGTTKITEHSLEDISVYSEMTNLSPSAPSQISSTIDVTGIVGQGWPDFTNFSGFAYPERRLNVSHDWMKFLDPMLGFLPGQNISLLSYALSNLVDEPSEARIAEVMSIILASALSRNGLTSAFTVTLASAPGEAFCDTCLKFVIQRSMWGWAYQVDNTGVRLAITVMLAYSIFAVGHVLYAIISGVSSTAWDSVAELVALAMNSRPTEVLQNTCAGIIGVRALKTPVQILETTDAHLELCFSNSEDSLAGFPRVKANEKYGGIVDGQREKRD